MNTKEEGAFSSVNERFLLGQVLWFQLTTCNTKAMHVLHAINYKPTETLHIVNGTQNTTNSAAKHATDGISVHHQVLE